MRILLAEDDDISRCLLTATLNKSGYDVQACRDGNQAWEMLCQPHAPTLLILDWMMPGVSGVDLCRRLQAEPAGPCGRYIILVTAKDRKAYVVEGLDAGADDYLVKPFGTEELRAKVRAGMRIMLLRQELHARIQELELTMSQVRRLESLLPICSYCKKIRDENDHWQQVDSYIAAHTGTRFSHGVCPECFEIRVEPELALVESVP